MLSSWLNEFYDWDRRNTLNAQIAAGQRKWDTIGADFIALDALGHICGDSITKE